MPETDWSTQKWFTLLKKRIKNFSLFLKISAKSVKWWEPFFKKSKGSHVKFIRTRVKDFSVVKSNCKRVQTFPRTLYHFQNRHCITLIEALYLIDHFNSQNSDGIIAAIDYRLIHHIFGKQKIYKIGKKRNCPTEISAKIISKKISHRLLTVLFFRTSC